MNNFVTNVTYRPNIQPVFLGVAVVMMVMFGLFGTALGANQGVCTWKFAGANRALYRLLSLSFFGMISHPSFCGSICFISITQYPISISLLSLVWVVRSPKSNTSPELIGVVSILFLSIQASAIFTATMISIWSSFIAVKIAQRFYVFACSASFFLHCTSPAKQKATGLHLPFCRRNKHLHKPMALCRQIKNVLFLRQLNYSTNGLVFRGEFQ